MRQHYRENRSELTKCVFSSLSVHSFHNDSPPLAPADSSRRYSQDHRWTQGGSHGSLEELPPLDLLSESVEESSGYASGSEESASKHLSSSPPLQSHSGSSSCSIPIPPNITERRDQSRPLHASPDSRPPPQILQRSMNESDKALTHSNSFGMSGSQFLSGHISSDDMKDMTAGIPIQATSILDYDFPRHRLPIKLRGELECDLLRLVADFVFRTDESKQPLVIVACGSFSPCECVLIVKRVKLTPREGTYLHLRIFEMAKDSIFQGDKFEILAG